MFLPTTKEEMRARGWDAADVILVSGDAYVDSPYRMPAGNVVVEEIAGDTVRVRPDLRDTEGDWFYWAFRVAGAAGTPPSRRDGRGGIRRTTPPPRPARTCR